MHRGTQIALGDTGSPEDRVVRIINLPYDAEIDCIRAFFGRHFTVVDFVRGVNVKSRKYTIGYVLFATEQERIKAQVLSGLWLLDREIQIVPAQSGFRISESGDTLLPVYDDRSSEYLDEEEAPDRVAPAVGDFEAFPSLYPVAKSLPGPHAPVVARQRVQRWDLNNRVLFMNNVGQGPEVNQNSFRLFFDGYTIVDIKRPMDIETQKPNPTAFVMLASEKERDEALNSLRGVPMQGRMVTLEVPKLLQNVDEFGFVSTSKTDVVTFSSPRYDTAATNALCSTSAATTFSNEGLQGRTPGDSWVPSLPSSVDINADFYSLLGELKTKHSHARLHIGQESHIKRTYENENARHMNSTEVTWGMSREALSNRHMSFQRTLLPVPSATEGPGQIITGSPIPSLTIAVSHCSHSPDSRPRELPRDVNTSFCPREYAWGLGKDQDSARHFLSEEAWYAALPKRR